MISTYTAGLLADIGILLLGATSVYVILSTGQLSLGNAGFMGIGAYAAFNLSVHAPFLNPYACILLSGFFAAAVGIAGVMLAGFFYMNPNVGASFALIAYVTVALGGFGSVAGALVAGISLTVLVWIVAYAVGGGR